MSSSLCFTPWRARKNVAHSQCADKGCQAENILFWRTEASEAGLRARLAAEGAQGQALWREVGRLLYHPSGAQWIVEQNQTLPMQQKLRNGFDFVWCTEKSSTGCSILPFPWSLCLHEFCGCRTVSLYLLSSLGAWCIWQSFQVMVLAMFNGFSTHRMRRVSREGGLLVPPSSL